LHIGHRSGSRLPFCRGTLDALSAADPEVNSKLADVVRRFVAMRDELIAAQRAGAACGEELSRVNAILSSIFGMEFPSEGLQWQRVCDTRDACWKTRIVNEREKVRGRNTPGAQDPSSRSDGSIAPRDAIRFGMSRSIRAMRDAPAASTAVLDLANHFLQLEIPITTV
jgi:hypothetical protein